MVRFPVSSSLRREREPAKLFLLFANPPPPKCQENTMFFKVYSCGGAKSSKAFGLLANFLWILGLFSGPWKEKFYKTHSPPQAPQNFNKIRSCRPPGRQGKCPFSWHPLGFRRVGDLEPLLATRSVFALFALLQPLWHPFDELF